MNLLTRRRFLNSSLAGSAGIALGSLLNVPGFLRSALADTNAYTYNGNKILFLFLRGGNDGINTLIPHGDTAYNTSNRPSLYIPPAAGGLSTGGVIPAGIAAGQGLDLGNGFASLHPAMAELAPLYNAGELALIHRVGYPNQSRSHFDSERYWETGVPQDDKLSQGILYRALVETGLHQSQLLPAVTMQDTMPLILRGEVPMANISDPARYDLLGVYAQARQKHMEAIGRMHGLPHPDKHNREVVFPTGRRFVNSINEVQSIDFSANGRAPGWAKLAGSPFLDDDANQSHLFPVDPATDDKGFDSYNAYSFFRSLKYSAQILANTDAVVTGTEMGGYDTHDTQGGAEGSHSRLLRRVAWGLYALKKYLGHPDINLWHKTTVITLSEFGRTSVENGSVGTDHAEAGVMFVAGGNPAFNGGVYECSSGLWEPGQSGGAMFQISGRYLSRRVDYRSVFGEVIRKHLAVPADQINRIIPGYANPQENLLTGGTSIDGTAIRGELGLFS